MTNEILTPIDRAKERVSSFKKDEQGSMIVFTLFLLVLMLIVSGMAVDFMRFEARRTLLQGTLDQAVLAAADLDQELECAEVVADYLNKAGLGGTLAQDPYCDTQANYREVRANGAMVLDTYFLKLIGMESLTAGAASSAIEGVGNIEVSLVVDISGSMRDNVSGTSTPKIDKLEDAATAFVNQLLQEDFEDRVSLSLVPYSEHVNIGEDIYNALNVNQKHSWSTCIELPDSAYNSLSFDDDATYEQVQHFQWNLDYQYINGVYVSFMTMPVCPDQDFEAIIPISQNKTVLIDSIENLTPRAGTSIFLGLKWGLALLDPDFTDVLDDLPANAVETVFDNRPEAYATTENPSNTKKYLVLMTDGQNDFSMRLFDELYDEPSEIAHWNPDNIYNQHANWGLFRPLNLAGDSVNEYTYTRYTATQGDGYMQTLCGKARDAGVIIYTIAMDAQAHGRSQMQQCAFTPGYYYETSGDELVAIFEAIAEQITDLRLTQ